MTKATDFEAETASRGEELKVQKEPNVDIQYLRNFLKSDFFAKNFNLCGRRRRGWGPLAAFPRPVARRAPAAAATASQFENFCEKVFIESTCYRIFYETPLLCKESS